MSLNQIVAANGYTDSTEVNWWSKKIQRIKYIKLRWFQIRIVHRILGAMLEHMGVEGSSKIGAHIQPYLTECLYFHVFSVFLFFLARVSRLLIIYVRSCLTKI